jgi:uncharacterized protein
MEQHTYQNLLEYISSLPVIDCHEHTYPQNELPQPVDLWTIFRNSDAGDDLISAGMPESDRPKLDWNLAAPYLPKVQNTGFFQSLRAAFQDLFDFQEAAITAGNWQELSNKIIAANHRDDWYAEVLQRRGNIRLLLRVQGDEANPYAVDRRFFSPLINLDGWIMAGDALERERLAQDVGGSASTLKQYLDTIGELIHKAKENKAAGLKSMLAYYRSLDISSPDGLDAGRLFRSAKLEGPDARLFQDFMINAISRLAGVYELPYQLHAGYGSWQSNIVERSNPLLLNPLFEAHRKTNFVLLHGGYPYISEMATLAKNHPNVFIECGWLAYIAPSVYRRALGEWLDTVPMNKITAFSADCRHVEQTYGALILTRRLLASVFQEKLLRDDWGLEFCRTVAGNLLANNAVDIYNLDQESLPNRL